MEPTEPSHIAGPIEKPAPDEDATKERGERSARADLVSHQRIARTQDGKRDSKTAKGDETEDFKAQAR
jgi:hypothetical protein